MFIVIRYRCVRCVQFIYEQDTAESWSIIQQAVKHKQQTATIRITRSSITTSNTTHITKQFNMGENYGKKDFNDVESIDTDSLTEVEVVGDNASSQVECTPEA